MSSEDIKKSAETSRRNHRDSDSLTTYLNNVGKISPADPAALQELANSIDQLHLAIEERLPVSVSQLLSSADFWKIAAAQDLLLKTIFSPPP